MKEKYNVNFEIFDKVSSVEVPLSWSNNCLSIGNNAASTFQVSLEPNQNGDRVELLEVYCTSLWHSQKSLSTLGETARVWIFPWTLHARAVQSRRALVSITINLGKSCCKSLWSHAWYIVTLQLKFEKM